MIKFLKNKYIWFVSLFKHKLTSQEMYKIVHERFQELLEKLEGNLLNPHQNFIGLLQLIKRDGNNLEFNFGDNKFLLEGKIYMTHGIGLLRTYLIDINKDSYPNLKLIHIENLDIFVHSTNGPNSVRFVKKKKGVVVLGVETDSTVIVSEHFGGIYINQLYQTLTQIEKDTLSTIDFDNI